MKGPTRDRPRPLSSSLYPFAFSFPPSHGYLLSPSPTSSSEPLFRLRPTACRLPAAARPSRLLALLPPTPTPSYLPPRLPPSRSTG
jgi:hypothetical protein